MAKSSKKVRRGAKGRGSITHRKDGRWMGRYTVVAPDGRRLVKFVYGKTQEEACKKLTQAIAKRDRGEIVDSRGMTVKTFYELWVEEIAPNYLRPSTVELYRRSFRNYILPELGKKKLSELSVNDVQRWFNLAKRRSLCQAIVAKKALSSLLTRAQKRQMIFDNPTRNIEVPKLKTKEPKIWDKTQLKRFLKEAKSSSYYLAYAMLASYGLRRGEVLGICWEDIDFVSNCIHLKRQIISLKNRPQIGELKTEGSVRDLPLNTELAGMLEERYSVGARGLIFKTKNNTPIAPRNFYRDFRKVVKRAGLPNITIHAFRHMAACFMRDTGVDPKTCQSILGHATLNTTLRIYQHSGMEHKKNASDKMGKLLFD